MTTAESARRPEETPIPALSKAAATNAHLFLALLIVLQMFNILERGLFGLLAQPIKLELKLSDLDIGMLGGFAFAIFYSAMGVPIAWICDRTNRINLVTVCAIFWSAATLLCGFAQNFWQLLFFRAGLGVGEAGYAPAAYSLIADTYPPRKRALAVGIFGAAPPIGTMIGGAVGGLLADKIGWRFAFLLLGAASVPVAVFFRTVVREPERGQFDTGVSGDDLLPFREMLTILGKKTAYIHLVIGQMLLTFVGTGQGVWMASFLMRNFHLRLTELGLILGLTAGIGATTGSLLGGMTARWLTRHDVRWFGRIQAFAQLLAVPILFTGFLQSSWMTALPFFLVGSTCSQICVPTTFAALQNMVGSRMRGTAVAVLMFFCVLVGIGGGPVFIGWLSDLFSAHIFGPGYIAACAHASRGALASGMSAECSAASASGLRLALLVSSLGGIWAAAHYFIASRAMPRDLIPAAQQG